LHVAGHITGSGSCSLTNNFFFDSDLLPNREDPDPVRKRSSGVDRILFTADQQFQLETLFQKKKFPVRKEKALLAAKLGVPLEKVTVCCELILAFDEGCP